MKAIWKIASLMLVLAIIRTCAFSASAAPFSDVPAGSYYAEAAQYCLGNGLISGTGEGKFSPDMKLSRGMLATVLWRNEGRPDTEASAFTDVDGSAYYAKAVSWAAENGIVSGYGGGQFGPEDDVERQQAAAMLYRYAQYKGLAEPNFEGTAIMRFADLDQVSEYARPALSWAVENGIVYGKSEDTIDPTGSAARAEAITIVYRYIVNVEQKKEENGEGSGETGGGTGTQPTPTPRSTPTPAPAPTPAPKPEETPVNRLHVSFNGHTYSATLENNPSAAAFTAYLKENGGSVVVHAHDYGSFEKVGELGTTIVRTDQQIDTTAGDIILYQGSNVCLYYSANSWNFTRLGKLDGDLSSLKAHLGSGNVDITYSLAD